MSDPHDLMYLDRLFLPPDQVQVPANVPEAWHHDYRHTPIAQLRSAAKLAFRRNPHADSAELQDAIAQARLDYAAAAPDRARGAKLSAAMLDRYNELRTCGICGQLGDTIDRWLGDVHGRWCASCYSVLTAEAARRAAAEHVGETTRGELVNDYLDQALSEETPA